MLEIAKLADVGAGTVYNYFKSKDELAVAVLEEMMLELELERRKTEVADPAAIYAFGIRKVLDTATDSLSWKQMLYRSEVIADALYRRMGPFAIPDIRSAVAAGRFSTPDPDLAWRLTVYAIVGASLAINTGQLPADMKTQIVVQLLCMNGIGTDEAAALAAR